MTLHIGEKYLITKPESTSGTRPIIRAPEKDKFDGHVHELTVVDHEGDGCIGGWSFSPEWLTLVPTIGRQYTVNAVPRVGWESAVEYWNENAGEVVTPRRVYTDGCVSIKESHYYRVHASWLTPVLSIVSEEEYPGKTIYLDDEYVKKCGAVTFASKPDKCRAEWDRALTDDEMKKFAENPYDIFKPIPSVESELKAGLDFEREQLDADIAAFEKEKQEWADQYKGVDFLCVSPMDIVRYRK